MPRLQPTDTNQPRGLDFTDRDPKVYLLFMSAEMCEKMLDF